MSHECSDDGRQKNQRSQNVVMKKNLKLNCNLLLCDFYDAKFFSVTQIGPAAVARSLAGRQNVR